MCSILLAAGASVNTADDGGMTPLHAAAERGHVGVCGQLLAAGAGVNVKTDEGLSPLKLTCCHHAGDEKYAVRRVCVPHGASIADLPTAGLAAQLPKYDAAVRRGTWTRRAAALACWVHWHDAADAVPSLAARVAARSTHAPLWLPPTLCVSCELEVMGKLTLCARCNWLLQPCVPGSRLA